MEVLQQASRYSVGASERDSRGRPPLLRGGGLALYSLVIFISAFLLFQVQPLFGRVILPWYGGSPNVWTTCMLFFQSALFFGYAYAHFLGSRLRPRYQGWLHAGLLLTTLWVLPIAPVAEDLRPQPGILPTLQILHLLLVNVGIPYFLLSSTGPLLQSWFSKCFPESSPYRLYALSNGGSLLALMSYPFLVEPILPLDRQETFWCWGFGVFLFGCGGCALSIVRIDPTADKSALAMENTLQLVAVENHSGPPMRGRLPLWLGLSALGSALFLATTNQLCQKVAVIPFLWVLPLCIYLLTFIFTFESSRWYRRRLFVLLLPAAVLLAILTLCLEVLIPFMVQIGVYSLVLFIVCLALHGELAMLKPEPRHLTLYYLLIAAGGALGGVFVALAAPYLFVDFWEYPLVMAGCFVLTFLLWRRDGEPFPALGKRLWQAATVFQIGLSAGLIYLAVGGHSDVLFSTRNFFGVLQVLEAGDGNGQKRLLKDGRILHGFQYLAEKKRDWPTTYFGAQSGIGLALQHHPSRKAALAANRHLRVGVVGLGTGTIAAFGREGDCFRFYEINPDVVEVSRRYFSFCRDSSARLDIVLGDARVSMDQELKTVGPQRFDVLAVDAFSGDAIPVHLLTKECVETYRNHLAADGLLLFHITNAMIDLTPVAKGLAERFGYQTLVVTSRADDEKGLCSSCWVILTNNQEFLADEAVASAGRAIDSEIQALLWTDDYSSLWQVLRL